MSNSFLFSLCTQTIVVAKEKNIKKFEQKALENTASKNKKV